MAAPCRPTRAESVPGRLKTTRHALGSVARPLPPSGYLKPSRPRLRRERGAAAAAARRVRVLEGEARAHDVRHVVYLDAVQVLHAEHVDEHADAVRLDDVVVGARLLLDVEAVLEARAAARHHADAEAGGRGQPLLARHELPNLL